MRHKSLYFIVAIFLIPLINAIPDFSNLHVQTQNDDGTTITGTFDFSFRLSNNIDCSSPIYTYDQTRTTNANGIVNFNLTGIQSSDIYNNQNLRLCYYRDSILKSNSAIGSVFYAYVAERVNYVDNSSINSSDDYSFNEVYAVNYHGNGSLLSGIATTETSNSINIGIAQNITDTRQSIIDNATDVRNSINLNRTNLLGNISSINTTLGKKANLMDVQTWINEINLGHSQNITEIRASIESNNTGVIKNNTDATINYLTINNDLTTTGISYLNGDTYIGGTLDIQNNDINNVDTISASTICFPDTSCINTGLGSGNYFITDNNVISPDTVYGVYLNSSFITSNWKTNITDGNINTTTIYASKYYGDGSELTNVIDGSKISNDTDANITRLTVTDSLAINQPQLVIGNIAARLTINGTIAQTKVYDENNWYEAVPGVLSVALGTRLETVIQNQTSNPTNWLYGNQMLGRSADNTNLSSTTIYAVLADAQAGGNSNVNTLIGIVGQGTSLSTTSTNVSIAGGVKGIVDILANTNVAYGYALYGSLATEDATSVITNMYGLYLEDMTGNGGVTNAYGVYSSGGNNYFNDNVYAGDYKVNLSSTGDVNATKFYGDGSGLTNVIDGSKIANSTNGLLNMLCVGTCDETISDANFGMKNNVTYSHGDIGTAGYIYAEKGIITLGNITSEGINSINFNTTNATFGSDLTANWVNISGGYIYATYGIMVRGWLLRDNLSNMNSTLGLKADRSEIPSLLGYATIEMLNNNISNTRNSILLNYSNLMSNITSILTNQSSMNTTLGQKIDRGEVTSSNINGTDVNFVVANGSIANFTTYYGDGSQLTGITTSGGSSTSTLLNTSFIIGGGFQTTHTSITLNFMNFYGAYNPSTANLYKQMVAPFNFTLKNFNVYMGYSSGHKNFTNFIVYKNNQPTNLNCTIFASGSTTIPVSCIDDDDELFVKQGDNISVSFQKNGSSGSAGTSGHYLFSIEAIRTINVTLGIDTTTTLTELSVWYNDSGWIKPNQTYGENVNVTNNLNIEGNLTVKGITNYSILVVSSTLLNTTDFTSCDDSGNCVNISRGNINMTGILKLNNLANCSLLNVTNNIVTCSNQGVGGGGTYTASSGVGMNGTNIILNLSTNSGLNITNGQLNVSVDNIAISVGTNGKLYIKPTSITNAMLVAVTTANKLGGTALYNLGGTPSAAGVIPTVNLGSGIANEVTCLRGNGVWGACSNWTSSLGMITHGNISFILGGGGATSSTSTAQAWLPFNGDDSITTTIGYTNFMMPMNATIRNLRVTKGSGSSATNFTLYVNSQPTALSCVVGTTAISACQDSHIEIPVKMGDNLSMGIKQTTTGQYYRFSVEATVPVPFEVDFNEINTAIAQNITDTRTSITDNITSISTILRTDLTSNMTAVRAEIGTNATDIRTSITLNHTDLKTNISSLNATLGQKLDRGEISSSNVNGSDLNTKYANITNLNVTNNAWLPNGSRIGNGSMYVSFEVYKELEGIGYGSFSMIGANGSIGNTLGLRTPLGIFATSNTGSSILRFSSYDFLTSYADIYLNLSSDAFTFALASGGYKFNDGDLIINDNKIYLNNSYIDDWSDLNWSSSSFNDADLNTAITQNITDTRTSITDNITAISTILRTDIDTNISWIVANLTLFNNSLGLKLDRTELGTYATTQMIDNNATDIRTSINLNTTYIHNQIVLNYTFLKNNISITRANLSVMNTTLGLKADRTEIASIQDINNLNLGLAQNITNTRTSIANNITSISTILRLDLISNISATRLEVTNNVSAINSAIGNNYTNIKSNITQILTNITNMNRTLGQKMDSTSISNKLQNSTDAIFNKLNATTFAVNDKVLYASSSGLVGIKTASPTEELSVVGNITINPDSSWSAGDESYILIGGTNHYIMGSYSGYDELMGYSGWMIKTGSSKTVQVLIPDDSETNINIAKSTDISGNLNTQVVNATQYKGLSPSGIGMRIYYNTTTSTWDMCSNC